MSLSMAIDLARTNPIEKLPKMAAVITTKRGIVLSYGLNSYKTHPLQAKFSTHPCAIHLHAEIAALARLGYKHLDTIMYVARVLKNGSIANAKPCSGCQTALIEFGVRNVIWT